jgi:hypothetical protein
MLSCPGLLCRKSTLMDRNFREILNSYQFIQEKLSVIFSPILIPVTYCMILHVQLVQTSEKDCFV